MINNELTAKLNEAMSILIDCSPATLDDPETQKIIYGVRKAFDLLTHVRNNYDFHKEAI